MWLNYICTLTWNFTAQSAGGINFWLKIFLAKPLIKAFLEAYNRGKGLSRLPRGSKMERMTEQVPVIVENDRALARVKELRNELEALQEGLHRLGKAEAVLEGQSQKKQENLLNQLKQVVESQDELRRVAREDKSSKEERRTLRKQFEELERQKRFLLEAIKLAERRGKALSYQIALLRRKREFLSQRVASLGEIMEISDEVAFGEKELETLYERTYALKKPVAEEETNLRKQLIDLVFKFHLPDRKKV